MINIQKQRRKCARLNFKKLNDISLRNQATIISLLNNDIPAGTEYIMTLIKKLDEGKKLYRFRPPESYEVKALKELNIYLSCASGFNDNSDCRIVFALQSFLSDNPSLPKKTLEARIANNPKYQEALETFRRETLVACFSQNYSEYMWKEYANKHTGFCLEYDIEKIAKYIDLQVSKSLLMPVRYVPDRSQDPHIMVTRADRPTETCDKCFRKCLLACVTKDEEPYYKEGEWRIMIKYAELKPTDNGILYPFIKPERIVLGSNISASLEKDIIDATIFHQIPFVKESDIA